MSITEKMKILLNGSRMEDSSSESGPLLILVETDMKLVVEGSDFSSSEEESSDEKESKKIDESKIKNQKEDDQKS
jgi:hypothetical protein